jgi:peptide/nickel transport system permease protein
MRYLARRAVWTILAVLGVSVLIFLLVRLLPGNIVDIIADGGPVSRAARGRPGSSPRPPLPIQYLLWPATCSRNFGWSFRTGQPVATLIARGCRSDQLACSRS